MLSPYHAHAEYSEHMPPTSNAGRQTLRFGDLVIS